VTEQPSPLVVLPSSQTSPQVDWMTPSPQVCESPLHVPPEQVSSIVHVIPSLHDVPSGWNESIGQVALEPVQLSATSQSPADGRQTAVLGANASGGHTAPAPVQVSATSQMPLAERHCCGAGAKASAGQSLPMPSQVSVTSQSPAEPRHSSVLAAFASGGHIGPVPVQLSATSQTP
jgi:hypothetical protein